MLLFTLPDFTSPDVLFGLLTLTFLEIVLGVDNIIFISIISSRLPAKDQPKARRIGLMLAMLLRILLLFGIGWVISLTDPIMPINFLGLHGNLTGQGIILMLGGVFLLYKATSEIHHKLEEPDEDDDPNKTKNSMFKGLSGAVIQIGLINIVFSFDSILTAIGMSDNIIVMMAAVVISILIMMAFSGPVSKFVNEHPTIQMLGLSFLILIGFSLIAEAAHLGHFLEGAIPKGYLYFAIFFSLFVEFLNIKLMKKSKPLQMHGVSETAKKQGKLDDDLLD